MKRLRAVIPLLCLVSILRGSAIVAQEAPSNNTPPSQTSPTSKNEVAPDSALKFYNQGVELGASGNYSAAIDSYSRAIALNPKFIFAYVNRGVAWFKSGNLKAAQADFDQALRLNRNYSVAYTNRAVVSLASNKPRNALVDLNQAIFINQNWGAGGLAKAYALRGLVKLDLKDRRGALGDANWAIRLSPRSSFTYHIRGEVLATLGKRKQAITDFTRALELNADWEMLAPGASYASRGLARRQVGDKQGAIIDLRRAADFYQRRGDEKGYLAFLSEVYRSPSKDIRIDVNLPCYGVSPKGQVSDLKKLCGPAQPPVIPASSTTLKSQ